MCSSAEWARGCPPRTPRPPLPAVPEPTGWGRGGERAGPGRALHNPPTPATRWNRAAQLPGPRGRGRSRPPPPPADPVAEPQALPGGRPLGSPRPDSGPLPPASVSPRPRGAERELSGVRPAPRSLPGSFLPVPAPLTGGRGRARAGRCAAGVGGVCPGPPRPAPAPPTLAGSPGPAARPRAPGGALSPPGACEALPARPSPADHGRGPHPASSGSGGATSQRCVRGLLAPPPSLTFPFCKMGRQRPRFREMNHPARWQSPGRPPASSCALPSRNKRPSSFGCWSRARRQHRRESQFWLGHSSIGSRGLLFLICKMGTASWREAHAGAWCPVSGGCDCHHLPGLESGFNL
ncbi:translation initiation factor IF-2-like [Choloepus didactylus]|uniref:translation initiation factor IF-2-like n=1 Tax=Choloepus didactylus TaxID=27675 RepID=UPI00189FF156|nr:translation initiation factor IF-2-like [Choloepus didactylus]